MPWSIAWTKGSSEVKASSSLLSPPPGMLQPTLVRADSASARISSWSVVEDGGGDMNNNECKGLCRCERDAVIRLIVVARAMNIGPAAEDGAIDWSRDEANAST